MFRSVIVEHSKLEEARAIKGEASFLTGIGEVWDNPATHYIEAGEFTDDELNALASFCTVSEEAPIAAMGGMQQVRCS